MMKMPSLALKTAAVVMLMGLNQFASAAKAELVVSIDNIRNSKGSVLVSIYKDGVGFPGDVDKAVDNLKLTTKEAEKFVVENLAPGDYAISMLHDENGNGKMDKKKIFLPAEGFGFSNDKMGKMGPPSYEKSKFTVKSPKTAIRITMKYM